MLSQALTFKPELISVLRPLTDQPLEGYAEELMVLELYRRRQISSGKAAELLGMDRVAFIQYASRLGVAFFDMSEQELATELENLISFPATIPS
jgi:predicted HTH domain antitoxin